MVRQYIGARYVFKIYENSVDPSSAEWEAGVTYEPLTVVTYLNSSYASKKAVPGSVGDPASNPDYWIVTGAYNGQIAALQQQITNLNTSLGTLSQTVEPAVMKLKNSTSRKVLFIGDSYGGVKYNNQDLCYYAAQALGCAYEAHYHAGYGFTNINQQGTYLSIVQNDVTSNRDEFTDIVVFGGCNDYDTVANTIAAIKSFCAYCFTEYPNAKITIAHLGGFSDNRQASQIHNKSLKAYRSCGQAGAVYMQNSEYIMNSAKAFESDATHPIPAMVPVIGGYLADGLISGICNVNEYGGGVPTEASTASAQGFHLDTGYLPAVSTFINNNTVGIKTTGYRWCTIVIDSASLAFNNGEFNHALTGPLPTYGFPTAWNTGAYAGVVKCTLVGSSSTVDVIGQLRVEADRCLHLTFNHRGNVPTSIAVIPLTEIFADFDALRRLA